MRGDPEFVILKHTAWLPAPQFESDILGSIIRYPLMPSNDFVPPSPLKYNASPFHEGTFEDFVVNNTAHNYRGASLALPSHAGFTFKGNVDDVTHLSGKRIRYRRLTQHSQFWARLKTDATVAGTVPGWISLFNSWPPCLVVGIMTATAVELDLSSSTSCQHSGALQLPIATIALTAGAVPPTQVDMPAPGDQKAEAGARTTGARVFRAVVPDERIFALELRIVTTATLRRQELALKEGGPRFKPGRLADDGDELSSEDGDGDEPPAAEELTLEKFTDKEYMRMVE